ncbi:MAG: BspA family leucine-rich repeat surface protein [Tissierellia bacterium]|nr:BspA family leucine-rich repeat surface protein [Tissierellia bacterium]
MKKPSTSLFVKNQLPNFVVEEYPNFVLFIEAYYEFLENEQIIDGTSQKNNVIEKLKDLRYITDITKSLDEFEDQFFNVFAPHIPRNSAVDKEFLIKHILELYNSKGSEQSFKLFFRLLFGEEVDIDYPKDHILRASDGKWVIENYLKISSEIFSTYYGDGYKNEFTLAQRSTNDTIHVLIENEEGDLYEIPFFIKYELKKIIFESPIPNGHKVLVKYSYFDTSLLENREIRGVTSGAHALIEKISGTNTKEAFYYQLFFNVKTLVGYFKNGEMLECDFFVNGELVNVEIKTLSNVYKIEVKNPGSGYSVGDPVILYGKSETQARAMVSDVETGTVDDLYINDGGAGYAINGYIYVEDIDPSYFTAQVITIDSSGLYTPNNITFNVDIISPFVNVELSAIDFGINPNTTSNLTSTINETLEYITIHNLGSITSTEVINTNITTENIFYAESPTYMGVPIINLGSIGKISVSNPGSGYSEGDPVNIISVEGDYTGSGANAYVSGVNISTGGIVSVRVVNGGYGYKRDVPPNLIVDSSTGSGAVLMMHSLMGQGASFTGMLPVTPDGDRKLAGEIKEIKVIYEGEGYDDEPHVDLSGYGDGKATADAFLNYSYEELPGRWATSDSIISSSDRRLQGLDYYVDYTYVLKSMIEFSKYRDILMKILHPAGMKAFAEYIIYYDMNYVPDYKVYFEIDLTFTGPDGDPDFIYDLIDDGNKVIWYDIQDHSTLFQDALGKVPVYIPGTGVGEDPPVGLILDKAQKFRVGPELIQNGGFDTGIDGWSAGSSASISWDNGEALISSNGQITNSEIFWVYYELPNVAGNKFLIEFDATWVSGAGLRAGVSFEGGLDISPEENRGIKKRYSFEVFDTSFRNITDNRVFLSFSSTKIDVDSLATWKIDNVSCRMVYGTHAVQPTTTARPILSRRYNILTGTELLSNQTLRNYTRNLYILRFNGPGTITLSGGTETRTYHEGIYDVQTNGQDINVVVNGIVRDADFREKDTARIIPKYQSVVNSRLYDIEGFPSYLKFDQVDDFLTIPIIEQMDGSFIIGTSYGNFEGLSNIPPGEKIVGYYNFPTTQEYTMNNITELLLANTQLSQETFEGINYLFNRSVYRRSKVENFISAPYHLDNSFRDNKEIKDIFIDKWNMKEVGSLSEMFANSSIENVYGNDLKLPKIVSVYKMFANSNLKLFNVDSVSFGKNTSLSSMFNYCDVENLDLSNWNISGVTDLSFFVHLCPNLASLGDISNWDTSKVTNLYSFAYNSPNLILPDISKWDVSKAENISQLIAMNLVVTNLDLSSWDTSSLINCGSTFNGCSNLETLNVSNWDTSKVTNFNNFLYNCVSLIDLNISGWDTGNVAEFTSFADGCSSLTTLDVSNWDTSKVTNFSYFARGCSNLESFNISNWRLDKSPNFNGFIADTPKLASIDMNNLTLGTKSSEVISGILNSGSLKTINANNFNFIGDSVSISNIFSNNNHIEILNISGWNLSNIIDANLAIVSCSTLKNVNASNWTFGNTYSRTVGNIFDRCYGIDYLDLSGWDFGSSVKIVGVFNYGSANNVNLSGWKFGDVKEVRIQSNSFDFAPKSLDISGWDTSKIENFSRVCYNIKAENIDISGWDTSNVINFESAFRQCNNVKNLDVSNWNTSNVTNFSYFATGCTSLTTLDVSNWDTSNVKSFDSFISYCSSLTTLDVSNWDTSKVTNFSYFAHGCGNLEHIYFVDIFANSPCINYKNAFTNTNLSQTSIDNILVSINNAGTSNGMFDRSGGSAPSSIGEAAITALRSRGWTVTISGPDGDPDFIYDSGNVAWTYTLPDDTETRNATGWEAGEANLFYDASGVPITVTGADILADQFINTWNVFFVEFDEFLETGRLIIYPEDISYSEAAALMRKHGLPVMISLYINEEILTINGEILTINQI